MSRVTATPLVNSPAGSSTLVTVGSALASWAAWSPWVTMVAATNADAVIAGFSLGLTSSISNGQIELAFGTGASGLETELGRIRLWAQNSQNGGPQVMLLPVPIGTIPSGGRIACRLRNSTSTTLKVSVLYYEDFDSTYYLASTESALTCAPTGANHTLITPSGTAWNNSSWGQLTAGETQAIAIAGIAVATSTLRADYEIDLGIGASGSETVLTTFRSGDLDGVGARVFSVDWLPGLHYVDPNTRISYRLRKSGTDTTQWGATLIFYIPAAIPAEDTSGEAGGGGTAEPATPPVIARQHGISWELYRFDLKTRNEESS